MLKRIMSIVKRDFKEQCERVYTALYYDSSLYTGFWTDLLYSFSGINDHAVCHSLECRRRLLEYARQFGVVEVFDSQSAITKRLSAIDEVIGVDSNGDGLEILIYGDEREGAQELAIKMVRAYESGKTLNDYSFSSLGESESPVALIGVISLFAMALALGGGIIGLNIIEEKEEGTVQAIHVSPVRQVEFFCR